MEDNLFDTEDKQQYAMGVLIDLQNHPGWTFFIKVIDANIAVLTHRLEVEEFETVDQMRAVQRTWQAYVDAKNTPQMIIDAYSRDNREVTPKVDPFESIEEFRAEQIRLRKKRG